MQVVELLGTGGSDEEELQEPGGQAAPQARAASVVSARAERQPRAHDGRDTLARQQRPPRPCPVPRARRSARGACSAPRRPRGVRTSPVRAGARSGAAPRSAHARAHLTDARPHPALSRTSRVHAPPLLHHPRGRTIVKVRRRATREKRAEKRKKSCIPLKEPLTRLSGRSLSAEVASPRGLQPRKAPGGRVCSTRTG